MIEQFNDYRLKQNWSLLGLGDLISWISAPVPTAAFTVDDTMAEIRYDLDDREIYNDIRSEIGILTTETIVDVDADYEWKRWYNYNTIHPDGITYKKRRRASVDNPVDWKLDGHNASDLDSQPYYDYQIKLVTTSNPAIVWVEITNTGSKVARLNWYIKYKYLATEEVTHEEQYISTLRVRAVDATSIDEYGRRVMNLTWSEGTGEGDMQALVDHYLIRYKDPVAKLSCVIKGVTDALNTQIATREISDLITVICTNLGLNAECFIDSISISDNQVGIPVCTWGLEIQRAYELLTIFVLDTSELDGPHILGS